jgi:hypothetical protein
MPDGNITLLPTAREVAKLASLRPAPVVAIQPNDREPPVGFEIDRRANSVVWAFTGMRLREPEDFTQLANLFLTNGWPRNYNALCDAELALSEPGPEAA